MRGFRLTTEEVEGLIRNGENPFFIDVRTMPDWEIADAKIKGALRMVSGDFEKRLSEIPRDRTIITY